ncbi:MAG: family 10 glycosylhydrolase [Kiritimatiellia bacterium]
MLKSIIILCSVFCIQTASAFVSVIHGYDSVPDGERGFARALALHVERWYKGFGVNCRISDDRNMEEALRNSRLAVLVYVSRPDAERLALLSSFISKGGKLIVFYSDSARLAEIMGMNNLGYQGPRSDGRWASMHFVSGAVPGVPLKIQQSSNSLILMAPVAGKSEIVAWWHDRKGTRTEPAWLKSDSGYWMTHVLLADGDAEAKGQMLLALAASYDSSLWLPASKRIMKEAVATGGAGGAEGMAQLADQLENPARRRRAQKAAAALLATEKQAESLIDARAGFRAWKAADDLRSRTWELYGIMQDSRKDEIRAVWDHSGMGLYPGNWKLTCELLKNAGITDIYVNVAGCGFAYYDSRVLPRSSLFDEYGDQLRQCLSAARPLGLRVHAWMLCFSTERATADRLAVFRKRGWLLELPGGRTARWLDPAVPEVRNYLVKAVEEMINRYAVSGVHLDFVRYPDFNGSLGLRSRRQFESATGKKVSSWPFDVKPGGIRHSAFAGWRAQQVSMFVNASRRTINRNASGKTLSAAVFGKYPSCLAAVGQDWESWLDIDLVDYVVPMNYTEDLSSFNEWVEAQCRTRKQRLRVIPGIGVTANESRLNAADVIDQINVVRQYGCPGFALFDLDTTLRQEILPVLRMGMTAP